MAEGSSPVAKPRHGDIIYWPNDGFPDDTEEERSDSRVYWLYLNLGEHYTISLLSGETSSIEPSQLDSAAVAKPGSPDLIKTGIQYVLARGEMETRKREMIMAAGMCAPVLMARMHR